MNATSKRAGCEKATRRIAAIVEREGTEAAAISLEREAAALTALAALLKVLAG